MRSVRSDQRGFTLIEVMLVCVLFLIVTGATLTAFTSFTTSHRRTDIQHDQAEEARLGLDIAARQLRNLANPTTTATTTIDRAEDYDFIFQTSDPAKTWVRYCLQTTAPASPAKARLWEAESATAALAAGMGGACPGTGWATARIVSGNVSNRAEATGWITTNRCTAAAAKPKPKPAPKPKRRATPKKTPPPVEVGGGDDG